MLTQPLSGNKDFVFVDTHWANIKMVPTITNSGASWIVVMGMSGIRLGEGPDIDSALAVASRFTRDRLQEIDALESEMSAVNWLIESAHCDVALYAKKQGDSDNEYAVMRTRDAIRYGRIQQRLQAKVVELKREMKDEYRS